MMKPTNQRIPPDIDLRYRTMLILWFALFASIGLYFLVTLFKGPEIRNDPNIVPNTTFTVVVTIVGTLFVLLSFVVKRKLLQRSVERQEVALVQQALIVACAMCEVSAMLGLLERFLFDSHEYYLLFLIAAIGMALHFPRREQLLSATYKTSWNGAAS
jgi:NADH:ubiquinone oxidoreductase subunit 2 (subunit N)